MTEGVAVIGLWHLGSVTAACLADLGIPVTGWDEDAAVVAKLNAGTPPLFEPGLDALVRKNLETGNLRFTSDIGTAVRGASVLFLSHDTPVDDRDEVDLSPLWSSLKSIAKALPPSQKTVLCVQSQVPVGSCDAFAAFFKKKGLSVQVACLPENLRLGDAIASFMNPDRHVLGGEPAARSAVKAVLSGLNAAPIHTDLRTAEMSKHATNALLGAAICFGNELSEVCELIGADGQELARVLQTDRRFGPKLPLRPGLSFSGGTLARDLRILARLGKKTRRPLPLINSILKSNDVHRAHVLQRIKGCLAGVRKPTLSVLGLTYKAGTSTLRRSLPVSIVKDLIRWGASVQAHDPKANRGELPKMKGFSFHEDPYQSMKRADAIVFLTDWPEFKQLDYAKAGQLLRKPLAIDFKNMFPDETLAAHGFRYVRCGRTAAAR